MESVDGINKQWYESWFDSKLYDLMYEHRDRGEAELFLRKLLAYLNPQPEDRFLDLACGTGRHSKVISDAGYRVTGIDLSVRKLKIASEWESDRLEFFLQDMRKPFRRNYYNFVVNLFTSFGYFEDVKDNEKVLRSVRSGLVNNGIFVLDYLNADLTVKDLVDQEVKQFGEWKVKIQKQIKKDRLIKHMTWKNKTMVREYSEVVSLFQLSDFMQMFERQGLSLVQTFGDYQLNTYNPITSPRLILIATC